VIIAGVASVENWVSGSRDEGFILVTERDAWIAIVIIQGSYTIRENEKLVRLTRFHQYPKRPLFIKRSPEHNHRAIKVGSKVGNSREERSTRKKRDMAIERSVIEGLRF
jgi:hypothetical protein